MQEAEAYDLAAEAYDLAAITDYNATMPRLSCELSKFLEYRELY